MSDGEQTQRAAFEKWIGEPRPYSLMDRHAWDDCQDAFYAGWHARLAAQTQRAPEAVAHIDEVGNLIVYPGFDELRAVLLYAAASPQSETPHELP